MRPSVWAMLILLSVVFSQASAKEVATIENGDLVIKRWVEVKRIPNVPEGISANTAQQLVTGQLKEYLVEDQQGKTTSSFDWPATFTIRTVFTDRRITFDGEWREKSIERVKSGGEFALVFFWVFIPLGGILTVSVINRQKRIDKRPLFVFCAVLLVALATGWFAGPLVGIAAGMLASVVGLFAAGNIGIVAGALPGIMVGWFGGAMASQGNHQIVAPYIMLLVVAMPVFILLSNIVSDLFDTGPLKGETSTQ